MKALHGRSLLYSTVKRNFAVHHNCHEIVIFCVLGLHNLMTTPRQLSPPAWLLRVLFNRLIFVPSDCERCGPQVLAVRVADRYRLTSTLTDVLVINCVAIDFRVLASIIGSFPACVWRIVKGEPILRLIALRK